MRPTQPLHGGWARHGVAADRPIAVLPQTRGDAADLAGTGPDGLAWAAAALAGAPRAPRVGAPRLAPIGRFRGDFVRTGWDDWPPVFLKEGDVTTPANGLGKLSDRWVAADRGRAEVALGEATP